jgi:hypothetical protein
MSGPFMMDETHFIFKGHFRTSLLGLAEKELGDGKFPMIRNLSKKDTDGVSVNDMLNSDDIPTRWGSAWVVEQYVSVRSFHHPIPSLLI